LASVLHLSLRLFFRTSVSKHKVEWHWLKGHAGHIGNERCDQLANEEIAKIKKMFSPDQLKILLAQFSAKDNAEQTSDELFENYEQH
jgi:RNase H